MRVIISCAKSLQYSALASSLKNSKYKTDSGKKTDVYTAATFKGLESDDVIIVDVAKQVFDETNKSFYVAASRAKKRLFIFMGLNVIDEIFYRCWSKSTCPGKDPIKQLAAGMHCYAK